VRVLAGLPGQDAARTLELAATRGDLLLKRYARAARRAGG